MLPILVLFLPGMAWGFSDSNIVLPGGHQPDTAMEVLFYASLGVVFGATMLCGLEIFGSDSLSAAFLWTARCSVRGALCHTKLPCDTMLCGLEIFGTRVQRWRFCLP